MLHTCFALVLPITQHWCAVGGRDGRRGCIGGWRPVLLEFVWHMLIFFLNAETSICICIPIFTNTAMQAFFIPRFASKHETLFQILGPNHILSVSPAPPATQCQHKQTIIVNNIVKKKKNAAWASWITYDLIRCLR